MKAERLYTSSLGITISLGRSRLGLSMREFGRRLGISAPHVCDIEKGRRVPSNRLMVKLAALLGVSVDSLIEKVPTCPVCGKRR